MSTIARVATVNQGGRFGRSFDQNREMVMALLDQALELKPDIVCLPEGFSGGNLGWVPLEERAETVPGPSTDACAERARRGRCYVICPLKCARGGRYWNSAVILDRDGQVAGVYDKLCPVTRTPDYTEMEGGITPASKLPVFDLDFGRVGVQICFDAGFPENWGQLADEDARLVFWSSAYDGGFSLRCYAYLHHYYVVSSVRRGRSRIIDPLGAILEESGEEPGAIHREINLDHVVFHGDFNHEVPGRIEAKYGERVEVRDSAPGSAHRLIEPRDADVTCAALMEEFGFESTKTYHDRHRRAYGTLRTGGVAPPQEAAHGERGQYAGE
jgi:predicted amidohydrolase